MQRVDPNTLDELLKLAHEKDGYPLFFCGAKESWYDCVTTERDTVTLWYNTTDGTTHIVSIQQ